MCARGTDGFVEGAEAIVAERRARRSTSSTRLIAAHLAPIETKRDYVKVFINERRYLPTASRRRIGRMSRAHRALLRAGDPGRHRRRQHPPDTDARLAMLAVLGMCNAVINWRPADQGEDVRADRGGVRRAGGATGLIGAARRRA